jgi:phytoene synthase
VQAAGGLWALTDAARHCSDAESRSMLLQQARTFARSLSGARFPLVLRPLSMLAAVAVRDCRRGEPFEAEGTPGRVATLLRHRISGRIPRL